MVTFVDKLKSIEKMLLECPIDWRDYELIDSGDGEKLERFGRFTLIRPEPKSLWTKHLSNNEWQKLADVQFLAGAGFGRSGREESGTWRRLKESMPDQWMVSYRRADFAFKLRLGLTSFKHIGLFPEQAPNWDYIYDTTLELARDSSSPIKVLNLFAYTGAASLTARAAGADVTHLDSVKQVVSWARTNMELSSMENIRWVIEDALKFVKREARRGNRYSGIIMDPPAYGHGPDGERWKLDDSLFNLLLEVKKILLPHNSYLVLNLYSNGYSALLADTLVKSAFGLKSGDSSYEAEFGELFLKDGYGRSLPLSVFSRVKF